MNVSEISVLESDIQSFIVWIVGFAAEHFCDNFVDVYRNVLLSLAAKRNHKALTVRRLIPEHLSWS